MHTCNPSMQKADVESGRILVQSESGLQSKTWRERETEKRKDMKEEGERRGSLLIGSLLSTLPAFYFFPSNRILCFVRDL